MRVVVLGLILAAVSAPSHAQTSDQQKKLAWCVFQAERMCRADQMNKPDSERDDKDAGTYCTAKAGEWCKTHA